MNDREIVQLYLDRNEDAIMHTKEQYGNYCFSVAYHILFNKEDAHECVNDAYLNTWNAIPPHQPKSLRTFIGKITRNLALNKFKHYHTLKRGKGQVDVVLHELEECVSSNHDVKELLNEKLLIEAINDFLGNLPDQKRQLFVRRYWYLDSIKEISRDYDIPKNTLTSILFRLRQDLKEYLLKENLL